jgi:hypothetical protein
MKKLKFDPRKMWISGHPEVQAHRLLLMSGIPLDGTQVDIKDVSIGDWVEYWDKDMQRRIGHVYKIYGNNGELRVRTESGNILKTNQILFKEKIDEIQVMKIIGNTEVENLYDPEDDPDYIPPAHHVHDGYQVHHVRLKDHSKLKVIK